MKPHSEEPHIFPILLYLQHWQLIYNIQQKISLGNWKMPPVQIFQGWWLPHVLLTSFLLHNEELHFLMGVPGSNLWTKCILLQPWKKLEDLVNLIAMPLLHTFHTDGTHFSEEEPCYEGKFFGHLVLASTHLIPYIHKAEELTPSSTFINCRFSNKLNLYMNL